MNKNNNQHHVHIDSLRIHRPEGTYQWMFQVHAHDLQEQHFVREFILPDLDEGSNDLQEDWEIVSRFILRLQRELLQLPNRLPTEVDAHSHFQSVHVDTVSTNP